MEELTKGEIKRRQKWAEWYVNIIKELSDCGVEARLIEKDDPKYIKKIEDWRHIVLIWRQKFGTKISEVHRLGNDVLRSWCYGGVFGESRYEARFDRLCQRLRRIRHALHYRRLDGIRRVY